MKIFLVILISTIAIPIFGQRDTIVKISDFNKDGFNDTLISYYDGGSGFGGRYVEIANGKSNEIYEINSSGCFCEIRSTILIPPVLLESKNISFLEAIKNQLLPQQKNSADPSLDWIIKGNFYHKELDSNLYLDLIIDPQTAWTKIKSEIPENYYLEIENDSLGKLYFTPYEAPEWYTKGKGKGFLTYYANQHRNKPDTEFTFSDSNNVYQVYRTKHGVVVQKGKLHKWVFISDYPLTDAPEKLRWESIGRVKLIDNYLLIQQKLPTNIDSQLFFVNIETGICGKLKFDLFDPNENNEIFRIQDKTILLFNEGKTLEYPVKEIFKELDIQTIPRY